MNTIPEFAGMTKEHVEQHRVEAMARCRCDRDMCISSLRYYAGEISRKERDGLDRAAQKRYDLAVKEIGWVHGHVH